MLTGRAAALSSISLLAIALGAGLLSVPASGQQGARAVGPTFDCQRANDPVAATVCSDAALKRLDVEFVQAFQALRHQLPEDQRQALRQDAVAFGKSVIQTCSLPRSGVPDAAAMGRAVPCVAQAYRAKRAEYLGRMSPEAAQEAQRDVVQHIALQARLAETGLITATSRADGVYGSATRDAIMRLQAQHDLARTGFLTDETERALSGTEVATRSQNAKTSSPPLHAVLSPSTGTADDGPSAGQLQAVRPPTRQVLPPDRSADLRLQDKRTSEGCGTVLYSRNGYRMVEYGISGRHEGQRRQFMTLIDPSTETDSYKEALWHFMQLTNLEIGDTEAYAIVKAYLQQQGVLSPIAKFLELCDAVKAVNEAPTIRTAQNSTSLISPDVLAAFSRQLGREIPRRYVGDEMQFHSLTNQQVVISVIETMKNAAPGFLDYITRIVRGAPSPVPLKRADASRFDILGIQLGYPFAQVRKRANEIAAERTRLLETMVRSGAIGGSTPMLPRSGGPQGPTYNVANGGNIEARLNDPPVEVRFTCEQHGGKAYEIVFKQDFAAQDRDVVLKRLVEKYGPPVGLIEGFRNSQGQYLFWGTRVPLSWLTEAGGAELPNKMDSLSAFLGETQVNIRLFSHALALGANACEEAERTSQSQERQRKIRF